ncbi:PREDICTED: uncharacterized protein LOC106752190 [Dinoponera quadriceps]|uniref:Uncharacterized protein LOC106752190 n=1 Tax=Dinoponera quadriceps TaxID=609295 RepID=A0A6P3YFG1_DINQU|nr:PREDICTED: uncharacterized protein LOC106752190 [Dinoponera quadriceps]
MGSQRILKTTMHAARHFNNTNSSTSTTSTTAAPQYGYYDTHTHSNVNILLAGVFPVDVSHFYPGSVGNVKRTGHSPARASKRRYLYRFAFDGAISGVILVVLILCYCCHKNVRKHRQHENSQHRRVEPDDHSLEVFAMDGNNRMLHEYFSERSASQTSHSACFVTSEPPPTYESIFDPQAVPSPIDKKDESDDFASIIAPRTGSFPTELEANWINKREDVPRDDQGLPSYEAALKLESDGYV